MSSGGMAQRLSGYIKRVKGSAGRHDELDAKVRFDRQKTQLWRLRPGGSEKRNQTANFRTLITTSLWQGQLRRNFYRSLKKVEQTDKVREKLMKRDMEEVKKRSKTINDKTWSLETRMDTMRRDQVESFCEIVQIGCVLAKFY